MPSPGEGSSKKEHNKSRERLPFTAYGDESNPVVHPPTNTNSPRIGFSSLAASTSSLRFRLAMTHSKPIHEVAFGDPEGTHLLSLSEVTSPFNSALVAWPGGVHGLTPGRS